jgi:hypothetical protein
MEIPAVITEGESIGPIQMLCIIRFFILKLYQMNSQSFKMKLHFRSKGISLQKGRDSNPRYVAINTLSKRAPSATRPPFSLCCK